MSLIRTLGGMVAPPAGTGPSPDFPANTIDLVGGDRNERLQVANALGWDTLIGQMSQMAFSVFFYLDSIDQTDESSNQIVCQFQNGAWWMFGATVTPDGELRIDSDTKFDNLGWHLTAPGTIVTNKQYHLAWHLDAPGNRCKVWLDGVVVIDEPAKRLEPQTNFDGGGGLGSEGEGAYQDYRCSDGYVCQFGLWTSLHSQADVDQLMTGVYPHTVRAASNLHSNPVDTDADPLADLGTLGTRPLLKRGTTTPRATQWPS